MSSLLKDDTRYVKLWLLLVKGGTYVFRKHTEKILYNDKTTIDVCLEKHKDKLYQVKKIYPKLWELLCSKSKDIDVLDISALAYVLLNLFGKNLNDVEIDAITKLKDKRNTLGHWGDSTLPEEDFLGEWSHLTKVLHQLSSGLSSNDQDYVDKVIGDISAIKHLDKAHDELKPFGNQDDIVKDVLAKLQCRNERRFQELTQRICELEKRLNEKDQSGKNELEEFKRYIERRQLELIARITVVSLTPTASDAASRQLLETAKRVLAGGHVNQEEDEVFTTFNNLLTKMSKDGASIKKVEEGSVLIIFSCSTLTSLKSALLYLTKTVYIQGLQELEKALSQSVGCCVKLNVNIVLESLISTLDKEEHCRSDKSVVLTVSCMGSKGVRSVCDNLVNGSTTNTVNNVAEALSTSVGEKIELHTSIDLDKLENEISLLERRHGYQDVQRSVSVKMFMFRYQFLLIHVGTIVLRRLFDHIVGPDFNVYLDNNPSRKANFQQLVSTRILTPAQLQLLPPIDNAPSSDKFDITLLACLLRHVCGLCSSSDQVWFNPHPSDERVEAYITRLRQCRNELAHSGSVLEDETVLTKKWKELCMILQGLSNFTGFSSLQQLIARAEVLEIDEVKKESFENAIKEWQHEIGEVTTLPTTVGLPEETLKQHGDKIAALFTKVGTLEESKTQHDDDIATLSTTVGDLEECTNTTGFDELFLRISEVEEIKRNPESGLLDITAKITRSSSTQTVFDAAHHQLLEAAKRCISGGNVNQEEDEVFTAFNIMSTDMSKDGASIKKVEEGSPLTALVYNVGQLSSTDERFDELPQRICALEEIKRNPESGQLEIIARITVSSSTQTACGAAHHKLLEAAKRCLTGGNVNQEEDEVFTACNNMFNDMSKDGASIKKVEEGSVWITISCSTLTSLKSAFLYLTKTVYNRRLQELGKALNQSVGCCVKLNVNISLESLISTLDKNVKMLVLSCLSIEVGTVVLRKVFDHIVGPDFNEYLDNYPDRKLIVYKLLLSTTVQLLLQHRNDNTPSSDRLYITDLTKLLRYVCGLCPSDDQVWVNPEPTDNRVEANITRLAKCNSIILKEGIEFENETQLTAKCNELCKILEGLSSFCGFNGLQEEINEVMLRIIDQLQQTEENIEREKEREIDELNLETGDLK